MHLHDESKFGYKNWNFLTFEELEIFQIDM